jgi:hypothetical protein
LLPQLVPSATFVPVAAHTDEPLAHVVDPFWQTLPPGWQLAPVMHATQLPPLHTWLLPHPVPSATLPVKPQVDAPVLQVVWPFWQELPPGWQATPAVQALQAPLLQTWFVPQVIPLALLPDWMQTDVPVSHDVCPARQTLLPGLQPAPAVHATQLPPLQTLLFPHVVPSATFAAFTHVEVPLAHDDVPVWQTLPFGLQAAPAVHGPH